MEEALTDAEVAYEIGVLVVDRRAPFQPPA
jgi:hypothetical protein